MAAWIKPDELRGFIKNVSAEDEPWLELAVDVGCDHVDNSCGPTLLTTITDEYVPATGKRKALLSCRVRSLVEVRDATTDEVVTTEFTFVGQTLRRLDGGSVGGPLLVTFTSGADAAPSWARSAALLIAQQSLRTQRRFATSTDGPVGFLVPRAAEEHMADHLLIRGLAT